MKTLLFLLLIHHFQLKAQPANCTLKAPAITVDFGSGPVGDLNPGGTAAYQRVGGSCPTDGHYTYTSYTSDCFRGDWITMEEDHTPGDASGNMMIVNASYRNGYFLRSAIEGLKPSTKYEFAVWMTNVCKLSDKCPYPLLPEISIVLQTKAGQVVMELQTGELVRRLSPQWTQYKVMFTTPANVGGLVLTMIDNIPGGCGNDFAVDDITFRECVPIPPPTKSSVKKKPVTQKPVANVSKPGAKAPARAPVKEPISNPADKSTAKTTGANPPPAKNTPTTSAPAKKPATAKVPATKSSTVKRPDNVVKAGDKPVTDTAKTRLPSELPKPVVPVMKERAPAMPPPPAALTRRSNTLFKKIEAEAGEIKIDLYDNGEIDGDTVTIYHNNVLIASRVRLSAQPVTLRIKMDGTNPHHELVMVANNLGSIPPNTSLMVVTAAGTRYEIFTSATEERNAKVVFDLKQ